MALQIGYKNQINYRFRKNDDSELGSGPENEESDEEPLMGPPKKVVESSMFY